MTESERLKATIQAIPWLSELSATQLDKIVSAACMVEKKAGEAIFHEGDKQDYLYIIIEGRVGIEMTLPGRGRVRLGTIEPMDIVGWSSVTTTIRQRTATARAVTPTRLIALDAASLLQLCEEDHDFGYLFMRRMANIIAGRLLSSRLQLLDIFSHPDLAEEP